MLIEFGLAVGHISAVDFAQHGERLGFTRCWVPDTPLIRSNLFATMAAVAMTTQTIKIGCGVAVCGMRLAPDCASGIASINVLAPGRTFAVIGAGNTAMRMLGQRPTGARALREYVRVVQAMLRGEEVMYAAGGAGGASGEMHPVRFTSLEQNYVRLDPLPEIHVAGNGPLSQAVARSLRPWRRCAVAQRKPGARCRTTITPRRWSICSCSNQASRSPPIASSRRSARR
jgi:5,10-methylenetetrahydromethanopterin reductase